MIESKPSSKTEQAYDRIKELIINGEIESGQMLSENRLCSLLHMSRTPIRNALKILEAQNFVSIAPKQGILVREVSAKRHAEIYELRKILEEHVVRNLLPTMTASDVSFLQERLAEQKRYRDQNDVRTFLDSDLRMHMFLFERYDNFLIKNVMVNLREIVYLTALKALSKPGRMDTTIREHQLFVDAIVRGDKKEAIKALRYHLKTGYSLLL